MRQSLSFGLLAIWLCGCETFPQLDAMITEDAEKFGYPRLLPLAQQRALGASERPSNVISKQEFDELAARAQRLRERGNILRQKLAASN